MIDVVLIFWSGLLKVRCCMHRRLQDGYLRRDFLNIWLAVLCALVIAACGGGNTTTPEKSNTPGQAFRQVLTFPNVGTTDVAALDPTRGVDQNSGIAVNMVYTFTLKSGITFSDGTPVTAQTYVDSWTRALLPSVASPVAPTFEAPIVGADDVANGKSKVLTGLKAVNEHTLQVTLKRPTSYFLQALTNNFFFPINSRVIARYGEKNWAQYIAGNGVGTGPLMVKEWQHNVKLVLVPNPHYYGDRTRLAEVDMLFVNDPVSAFKSYRAGQYDFVWNLAATDQQIANT